jgi:hypothetical protein
MPGAQGFHIGELAPQGIERVGDKREQDPAGAARGQRFQGMGQLLTRERLILKIDTGVSIDLKVEKGGGGGHATIKAQSRRGKSLGK